jgi:SAM-dependent methyltransferase
MPAIAPAPWHSLNHVVRPVPVLRTERQEAAIGEYLRTLRRLGLIDSERTRHASLADFFRHVDFTDKRMLDIGGGEGLYSFYAAVLGAREVVCLEPEADGSTSGVTQLFERIRQTLPALAVTLDSRPVQQYADAEGFDIVLMNASINHIDEQACIRLLEDPAARETFQRVFAHIATLVKPGGRLLVADCTRYNFFASLGLTNPFAPDIEWEKHQAPEVWAELLQDVGFRNPHIGWMSLYRFGKAAEPLFSNKVAAYFLKSFFRLEMEKA